MANKTIEVKVTFTQQQMELLEKLKQEGSFGSEYREIIVAVFREYIRQHFGKGGA